MFFLQYLTHCLSADGCLNCILNVGYIDAVTVGLVTVHYQIKVRLPNDTEESKVLHTLYLTHRVDNLIAFLFQCSQIVPAKSTKARIMP